MPDFTKTDDDSSSHRVRLGYATNAFPGETLSELLGSMDGPLTRIGAMLDAMPEKPRRPGLELRFGSEVSGALARDPDARRMLRDRIASLAMPLLTINAFSPLSFHSRRVKADAYRPTWLERERLSYSVDVARVYADLMTEGESGHLSTSPGSFKAFGHDDEVLEAVAIGYADAVAELARIEDETGRRITLCVEPEPGCSIETTEELIDFHRRHLFGGGRKRLTTTHGRSAADAGELLRRHFAATFDTAHLAVQFEDLIASAERLHAEGIRIGKVHATSAVRAERPAAEPRILDGLRSLARSPYMHQTTGVDDSGGAGFRSIDLPIVLERSEELFAARELRVHFHLPLFLDRLGELRTTSDESVAAVEHIINAGWCSVVVLETYTWDVLNGIAGFEAPGTEAGVTREIAWARKRFGLVD